MIKIDCADSRRAMAYGEKAVCSTQILVSNGSLDWHIGWSGSFVLRGSGGGAGDGAAGGTRDRAESRLPTRSFSVGG